MIVPLGYQLPGVSEAVMHDRFVCLVDPENPRLVNGTLSLRDLAEMPHAACVIGKSFTPADRQLETLGIRPKVQVSTPGFSVLPFLVSGTDLVTLVPERLAMRHEGLTRCLAAPRRSRSYRWWKPCTGTTTGTRTRLTAGCGRPCARWAQRWTSRSRRRPAPGTPPRPHIRDRI
ncbi:LysR substrate-binding domain-containing protein [Streptomyces sp. NPDC058457]|uniref:LysR substrate-binding domain-containing protein n=1 Tax=Streptomyces sp. NPDC058457 TaxID=3346507 RepID=UPI0036628DA5